MKKIAIEAKKDFLQGISAATPMVALSELVWNGLDAGSDRIDVTFVLNELHGVEKIQVRDYGTGINHAEIDMLFGNLGASWKADKQRFKGRALHGKNGKGRFKAFALGKHVAWNTIFDKGGELLQYQIVGRSDALDDLQSSDPVVVAGKGVTGTEVVVGGIEKSLGSLLSASAHEELAKQFAAYLIQYPDVKVNYNGTLVDPALLQDYRKDILLDDVELPCGKKVKVSISIIEWNVPTKRAIYLCDADGVSLHETEAGPQVRAPGFEFTAYVKSNHFRDLDKANLLSLADLHQDVAAILKPVKTAITSHFRQRLAARQSQIVQRWKEEKIYPYPDKEKVDPVEEAERQVFDILAVNVESYLPAFDDSTTAAKRFMFSLLAQAVKENPESVQKIITEVLNLKREEQEELAQLLSKTTLSAIISSARTVAGRLDFLLGLENLLFDKDTKKKLLERDQLHKILENEAWVFNEEFTLSGSEQRLEEVLTKHIGLLGERKDGGTEVVVGEDGTGRVDLLLHRAIEPRTGQYDYLIVELKRPSKKIDDDVITQVKKYAMAVAGDERFNGIPATWTFIAVSNEMTDYAKRDASQPNRPRGLVWESGNITVWVKEWAEVINNARARLQFVNSYLKYEADRDSAKANLQKTHAKFIPIEEPAEGDATVATAKPSDTCKPSGKRKK